MSNFMNKFKYFMGLEDLEDEYEEYEDYDEEELDIPQPVKVNNKVVSIHNNMNMKLVVLSLIHI